MTKRISAAFNKLSCLAALFLLLLSCHAVYGQNPRIIKFDHLTQKDGLSQSSGHTTLQDSEGFMWFGTSDGLNKYTGYEMTVYKHNPDDSTTISGNNITSLYEDSQNNLWVGTTGAGLNLFNRDKEEFTSYKVNYQSIGDEISNNSISSILEDSRGGLWVGTDYGLNYLDRNTGKFDHFFSDSSDSGSISNDMIRSIYEDSKGDLWIGTEDGLNKWDPESKSFRVYRHDLSDPYSLSSNSITKISEDADGVLWIGTNRGLNLFERDTGTFHRYLKDDDDPYSISGNSILSILEDNRGVLWIGTENNGLNVFDREEQRFYHYRQDLDDPHSLSNNAVYSLYENDDQILFVGTYSGGINYLDRKEPKFEHYVYDSNRIHSLSANSVTSFLEDSRNNLWVGTDGGGLNRFDRGTKQFYNMRHEPDNENSLSSDVVLALLEDQDGYVWIGYYNGGLSRYDLQNGSFRHFKHRPDDTGSLCQNDIFALYEDRQGILWAGSNGRGVCAYDPDTDQFIRYQAVEGVIRDIYEDHSGTLWLGTYGGGLKMLDRENGETRNFYEGDDGLRSNVVLVIHEDRKGNFWIGSGEGGLQLFDRDSLRFTSYSMEDGLPSNIVKGILEDDNGNLWLSSNNGISRFNPESETFTNYSIEDGLQGKEFNTLAYYRDHEGYMYFGGINGFNRFHPDSVQSDSYVYPVVFSDFKIFNRSVEIGNDSPLKKHISQTQQIELPYTASVLTFEYAALNFNTLKGIRYAYKMEGFEQDWNYVDNRRVATYTNLSPGKYTLRVKAANSDGIWNEEGVSLALIITPPFWQTTWFYILSVLFMTGIVFLGYRIRVRSITEQNKRLEQEVAARTSELDEKNSELAEKNENLKDVLKKLQETRDELVKEAHKAGMADIATGVLHNVGNILNSVNTSSAIIGDTLKKSQLKRLLKANEMLREHKEDLKTFIAEDPRGEKLLKYYLVLEEPFKVEQQKMTDHIRRLDKNIQLINDVIAAQQSYTTAGMFAEQVAISEVLEDALTLEAGTMDRHNIIIKKDLQATDPIKAQKTKLIHVLINLFKNAKEAMAANTRKQKELFIKIWQNETRVYLSITDNGPGIKQEHLTKIFTQGFTTKPNGHGFGLHSSANYMTEMGGEIEVNSKGEGKGTTFILTFPLTPGSTNAPYNQSAQ